MSDTQNLTKKRWTILFAACVINVMIGTGYAVNVCQPTR